MCVCDAGVCVGELVKEIEGSICWGPCTVRSGCETRGRQNVGAATKDGASLTIDRQGGYTLVALGALAFVGGCIAGPTRAW